jgi:hypothetical protein
MENTYQIEIEENRFVLKTTTFRVEKGSVLHSGIYNRELASSLAAGTIIILTGFFFAARFRLNVIHFVLSLFVFIILFLFFRIYVFRQQILELIIDKRSGDITIYLKNIVRRIKAIYPLSDLSSIKQDRVIIQPENPDGIKVVEKIALQHGTVIPGFGKTIDFYTLEFEFKDRDTEMIFSSRDESKTNEVLKRLKEFMER